MRDPAWRVLAASASLLLGAAAAGSPARAAGGEQAADAAELPYPYGDIGRPRGATWAQSAQADPERPVAGTPPGEPSDPDVTPSSEATAAQPTDAPSEPADQPPAGADSRSPEAITTEPAEPSVRSTADDSAEAGAADQPSQPIEAQSADAPPGQSSDADQAPVPASATAADGEGPEDRATEQPSQAAETQSADAPSDQSPQADLPPAPPSPTVTQLADWAVGSDDTGGLPFLIVDKLAAEVFVFDASGVLLGSAPALLGSALGDDTAPGVGDRELSQIPLEDRTTPAGRFIADIGPAAGFRSVLWVDLPSATSLHAVITNYPQERRLERLKSPNPDDRRITHGCINVPAVFYRDVVRRTFAGTSGVVYILPDTRSVEEVFPALADHLH